MSSARILPVLLVAPLAYLSCSAQETPAAEEPPIPSEELRALLDERDRREAALRQEILRLHRENFSLRLLDARRRGDESAESKLLLDEGLASPEEEFQRLALTELAALPEERRRELSVRVIGILERLEEGTRCGALEFLGRLGTKETEEALLPSTRHSSPRVRRAAAAALVRADGTVAAEALHDLLDDPDEEVCLAALETLGTLRQEPSVPVLADFLLRTDRPARKEKAVVALGNIGSPRAVPPLIALLREPLSDAVARAVIQSLGRIGTGSEDVLREILPFLEETRPVHLREAAIQSLGKLKDRSVVRRLSLLLFHPEPRLRTSAFQAVAQLASEEILQEHLIPAFVQEKDEEIRRTFWSSLLELTSRHFPYSATLAESLLKQGGFLPQIEELASNLGTLTLNGEEERRYDAILEGTAAAYEMAGDLRRAAAGYRTLSGRLPDRLDLPVKAARCSLRLGEHETAAALLAATASKLERGSEGWWQLHVEALESREPVSDPVLLLDSASTLLSAPPPKDPQMPVRAMNVHRRASQRLLERLDDPRQRDAARDSAIRAGKLILGAVADALEHGVPAARRPFLVEIGNAVAGTSFVPKDVAENDRTRKTAVGEWRKKLSER